MSQRHHLVLLVLSLVTLALTGCVRSAPWRISDSGQCQVVDDNLRQYPDVDLMYMEFTERGNLFSRDCADEVYDYIENEIQARERTDDGGVAVVVFIHGWKHNASPEDSNVISFRQALERYGRLIQQLESTVGRDEGLPFETFTNMPFQAGARKPRKIIGVYLGWRGSVLNVPALKELTYWDRKSVAEEIGKGGVTEVLLTLDRISRCSTRDLSVACSNTSATGSGKDNVFVTVGHSFGGAILLSAMSEIVMHRLFTASDCGEGCVRSEPLGNGVMLINPAIEANQAIQLRELTNRYTFPDDQDILMHAISTIGDSATHRIFPLGQAVSTWWWQEEDLPRTFNTAQGPQTITLREEALQTTTVGNYPPLWTGLLYQDDGKDWQFVPLTDGNQEGLEEAIEAHEEFARARDGHIYTSRNTPFQAIYTGTEFMSGHGDIFNSRVLAYISAIVSESLANVYSRQVPDACLDDEAFDLVASNADEGNHFSFGNCYRYYLDALDELEQRMPLE